MSFKIKNKPQPLWVKDLPTYITDKKNPMGNVFVATGWTYTKPKSIPSYIDNDGKRKKYEQVIRKKIAGVWVTFVK